MYESCVYLRREREKRVGERERVGKVCEAL